MPNTLELKFSHSFHGIIWNTLADGNRPRLFLEVRDVQEKKVSFSALNLQKYEWLWNEVMLEEPWWVSLAAMSGDILLFTMYTDTDNPDRKSLMAYDLSDNKMSWWYNGFSFSGANALYVKGIDARFPAKEIILDLFSGKALQQVDFHLEDSQNFPVIRPFQYEEGTGHFDTVRDFLQARLGIAPVATIDYLEFQRLIMVSVFVQENNLANYLIVLDSGGEVVFNEKLGENLKGVGLDTFFIYSDHLIFVKNKSELITYKIL
ncbi:MAG: DUF4905 domain-containing protein [Cyclobacteriaceae bacterium]